MIRNTSSPSRPLRAARTCYAFIRRGRQLRWLVPLTAMALAAAAATTSAHVSGNSHAAQDRATALAASTTVPLPDDCKPTKHPPPTEFGIVVKITTGTAKASAFNIDGLTPQICGIIRLVDGHGSCKVQGEVIIPSDGEIFPSDLGSTLTVVPGVHPKIPTTVHADPITIRIPCDESSKDGLTIDLPIHVHGTAGVYGLSCPIPLDGTAKSVITGNLFSGNYRGKVTLAGRFHADAITHSDQYCPGNLPDEVNSIAKLPDNNVQVSMTGDVAIYQAVS